MTSWAAGTSSQGGGSTRSSGPAPAAARATSIASADAGSTQCQAGLGHMAKRAGRASTGEIGMPAIASTKAPASATVRAIEPTVSSVSEIGFTPARGTVPKVGLKPTAPQ